MSVRKLRETGWCPAAGAADCRAGGRAVALAAHNTRRHSRDPVFEVSRPVPRVPATHTAQAGAAGRKAPVNDSWIAATAIAHQVPIVTQDADYDTMPDVEVIRL